MNKRIELQNLLEEILGSENVYFQPPATLQMKYDCIRYERSKIQSTFADNNPYKFYDRYQLILIYKNPDSELPKKIAKLPMCSHERHYTADNLHHDIFNLYF